LLLQRVHPDDRDLAQQVIDRASRTGADFEHDYRLLLADGRVKHVHAIAHAVQNASGNREFVGAGEQIRAGSLHGAGEAERGIRQYISSV